MEAPVVLPETGIDDRTEMYVSFWFVEQGDDVLEGDRLVEILAGAVTFDVPAPMSGRLVEIRAVEEDIVRSGDVLALVRIDQN